WYFFCSSAKAFFPSWVLAIASWMLITPSLEVVELCARERQGHTSRNNIAVVTTIFLIQTPSWIGLLLRQVTEKSWPPCHSPGRARKPSHSRFLRKRVARSPSPAAQPFFCNPLGLRIITQFPPLPKVRATVNPSLALRSRTGKGWKNRSASS